jgi:hypothetical protein
VTGAYSYDFTAMIILFPNILDKSANFIYLENCHNSSGRLISF